MVVHLQTGILEKQIVKGQGEINKRNIKKKNRQISSVNSSLSEPVPTHINKYDIGPPAEPEGSYEFSSVRAFVRAVRNAVFSELTH